MMTRTGEVIATLCVSAILAGAPDASCRAQGPAQTDMVQVSSVELVRQPGSSFQLVVHLDRARDHVVFWVADGRTAVVDIREAYTPYRGRAVGAIAAPAVTEVRASQFLDEELPIARFELDLSGSFTGTSRWVGSDLYVYFQPGAPGFRGTGNMTEAARTTAEAAAGSEVTPTGTETAAAAPTSVATPGGRVNPFDPLLKPPEGIDQTIVLERELPDAETLTLTGIVYREDAPATSVATLRDGNGLNYRLKQGDRVKYGFVRRITRYEIVFELDKYGRRYEHSITLRPTVR
jgi:hypothetical protein